MRNYKLSIPILGLFLSFICFSCDDKGGKNGNESEVLEDTNTVSSSFNFSFSSQLPADIPADADQKMLAEFAWNEFFALNWKSSYAADKLRDHPDSAWTYDSKTDPNPALLVWETYAHRSEYRPASGKLEDFDHAPHYDFKNQRSFAALGGASFSQFNNLDETNEIGSCFLFLGSESNANMVRYQAKCNRDQYDYVKGFASAAEVSMNRTTTSNNIKNLKAYYSGATNTCSCPDSVFCLPCDENGKPGAVEIKTAWRELRPTDDTTKYIVRNSIYFVQDSFPGKKIYYGNKKFVLIGIHIVRKTQNFNNFTFATFEHVDVEKEGYGYVLTSGNGVLGKKFVKPFPRYSPTPLPTADAIAANAAAHKALIAKSPNSKLQYYQLTGVQGNPVLMESGGKMIADSTIPAFYLANYVIESDSTLGFFHGSGIDTAHNQGANELYQGQRISGGGCQGCHGVAQRLGSDFSFISLGNSFEPDTVTVYPAGTETKLEKLARQFRFK